MLVTMHGTIMVFFVAMPILLAAFGDFLIPLINDLVLANGTGERVGPWGFFPALARRPASNENGAGKNCG
jgi:cytochrome c oxidase subunit I